MLTVKGKHSMKTAKTCVVGTGILVTLLLASCTTRPEDLGANPAYISPTPSQNIFDGSYVNPIVTGKTPPTCPDVPAPTVTVSNGLVTMTGSNFSLTGSVNTTGKITLATAAGRTFIGQMDQTKMTGRFTGPNCVYDVYWTRGA